MAVSHANSVVEKALLRSRRQILSKRCPNASDIFPTQGLIDGVSPLRLRTRTPGGNHGASAAEQSPAAQRSTGRDCESKGTEETKDADVSVMVGESKPPLPSLTICGPTCLNVLISMNLSNITVGWNKSLGPLQHSPAHEQHGS